MSIENQYYPVVGNFRISDKWGAKRGDKVHKGTDYVAPIGTPVIATRDGVLTKIGWQDSKDHSKGYGQRISMKYDNDDSGFEGTCH